MKTIKMYNWANVWLLNGLRHREDGPAHEGTNGYNSWWLNGELHREDGAAVENPNGSKSWYLNGKEYNKKDFHEKTKNKPLG